MNPLSALQKYMILGLGILCAILLASTFSYRSLYKAKTLALDTQNQAIKQQNEEARRKYDALKEERDALQTKFNAAKAAQEKKDEDFNKALAAMRAAVDGAPVRVRVASCGPRASGGGSTGGVRPATGDSSQADAAATGLLPAENSRRLNLALIEVEELSRDFNSCQAALLARMK